MSTGVFAVDIDGIESGPLSYLLSFDDGRLAANVHGASFVAIQTLVVLHVLALVAYRLAGRRLIVPMITGRDVQITDPGETNTGGGAIRALLALTAASGFAWWVSAGSPI